MGPPNKTAGKLDGYSSFACPVRAKRVYGVIRYLSLVRIRDGPAKQDGGRAVWRARCGLGWGIYKSEIVRLCPGTSYLFQREYLTC